MDFHQIFHTIISVYIVFGWILYPQGHGAACVAIITHWLLNKGRCVLSEGYTDDNGFTTEVLAKVGIDISNKDWLKKLIPYFLVLIPGLLSIYLSMKDIRIFGDVFGVKYAIGMMCMIIVISIWQAIKGMLGFADSTTQAITDSPTEAPEVPATSGGAVAVADADAPDADRVSTA